MIKEMICWERRGEKKNTRRIRKPRRLLEISCLLVNLFVDDDCIACMERS